jgi:hypothetical protein
MMNSGEAQLAVPTVTELQDATQRRLDRERTVGVRTIARMWTAALNLRRKLTDEILAPEVLIEQTAELVEREREQQHVIAGLHVQVDAHRATIATLTQQAPDSGSLNELEKLVREYVQAKAMWRITPSPDDLVFHDAMDETMDQIEAWVASQTPAKQEPEPEERDDDIPW